MSEKKNRGGFMGKKARFLVSLMLCCFMIFSYQLSYAAAPLNVEGIPVEVANSQQYVEIPIYQNGQVTSVISQYMEKNGRKGYANIHVKGYAYKTTDQIKMGVLIGYYGEDNQFYQEFFDGVGVEGLDTTHWPNCNGTSISLDGDLEWDGTMDNQRRIKVPFTTSYGKHFYRHTEHNVSLDEGNDQFKCVTLSGGRDVVDTYSAKLQPFTPYANQKIFEKPLMVKKDSTIQVGLDMKVSELSKAPVYQFIKSETVPTMPITTGEWKLLGDLPEAQYNLKEGYTDFVEEDGKISVQHYLFTGSYKNAPSTLGNHYQYPRSEVFKYPVGGVVTQKTLLQGNTTYSTQEGAKAFFNKSSITTTETTGYFVPKESGEYTLCVRSATGAYGTITIDGKKKVFVNELGQWTETRAYYRRTNHKYYLQAGKSYPIYMKTQYYSNKDLAPCFMYSLNGGDYQMITPDLFKDQRPSNGSCRAAKLWGFLQPDVTGTFNFGLYADDGAYGYLNVAGENIVFVDDFGFSSPTDQSNGVSISVEKGKVYPLYIEWYEGCPVEQALAPRYKEPGEKEWKDIPAKWFHPSKSTKVAEQADAMYEPLTVSKEVSIPNEGKNYLALKLTNKHGVESQVLYGPFTVAVGKKVEEIKPNSDSEGNYIIPGSLSNFNAWIQYETPSKETKYTIDLSEVMETKTKDGKSCFDIDLNEAVVDIQLKEGGKLLEHTVINPQKNASGQYLAKVSKDKYVRTVVGNNIILSLTDEAAKDWVIKKGQTHVINIYFRTQLKKEVQYGGKYEDGKEIIEPNSYVALVEDIKVDPSKGKKAKLTISRKPMCEEAIKIGDEVIEQAEFAKMPKIDTVAVPVELRKMLQIH